MRKDLGDALNAVDLNLLYTFFLVVESGGVGRAARLLGRTQPAVTARLQQLEAALGAPLLERRGRGVVATRLGRDVMDDVRALVGHARHVVDLARDRTRTRRETLRVGALPMVGVHVVAPVLAVLGAEHPTRADGTELRPDFELKPALVDDLFEGLRSHEIDVALSVGALATQAFTSELLGHVCPVVIGLGELGDGPVTARALASHDLASYPASVGDPFYLAVEDYFREHDLVRRVRYRVPHIQTMKALVRAGAGLAVVPDYTGGDADLVSREIADLDLRLPLIAWVRAGARRSALVKRFLELVRARAG
ncbi:MAG: LysR family transcriptional regulator [Deltaproteobacteria bacterium]|nr:LysR family transcriptional regulator [Deltaproteobacteria bacterium]